MSTQNRPSGFDRARDLLGSYEARENVARTLRYCFGENDAVRYVAIDTWSRSDKVYLAGLDSAGETVVEDSVYVDEELPWWAPEFDVADEVALEVALPDGFAAEANLVDMGAVRTYDVEADHRETRESMAFLLLEDMTARGDVAWFALTRELVDTQIDEETDAPLTDLERSRVVQEVLDDPAAEGLLTPTYDRFHMLVADHVESVLANRRPGVLPLVECPRHSGAWGEDSTCRTCVEDDGDVRVFPGLIDD